MAVGAVGALAPSSGAPPGGGAKKGNLQLDNFHPTSEKMRVSLLVLGLGSVSAWGLPPPPKSHFAAPVRQSVGAEKSGGRSIVFRRRTAVLAAAEVRGGGVVQWYGDQLMKWPILTKSCTCLIIAMAGKWWFSIELLELVTRCLTSATLLPQQATPFRKSSKVLQE